MSKKRTSILHSSGGTSPLPVAKAPASPQDAYTPAGEHEEISILKPKGVASTSDLAGINATSSREEALVTHDVLQPMGSVPREKLQRNCETQIDAKIKKRGSNTLIDS